MTTSSDLLRTAASLIRERAEAATGGAWVVEVGVLNGIPNMVVTADSSMVVADTYDKPDRADAEHIAALSPAVALAVADWLDGEAGYVEHFAPSDMTTNHAIAVARAYLADSTP